MEDGRMHIALFIYCLKGGGAQRRTVTLANGFAERGHRVDLVVVSSDESRGPQLHPAVRVYPLDAGWRHWFEFVNRRINVRGLFTLGSIPTLARYLRRERPDVILSAASHVNLVAACARQLSATRIPLVLRVSNSPTGNLVYWPFVQRMVRRFLRALARRLYPLADAIITVSEGLKRDLQALTRIPAERITTIYNPVVGPHLERAARVPVDHPWLAAGDVPVVLGVGKFKLQKDFPLLIRAFARVRRTRPARLIILGEGAGRGELEALVRHLGLTADVALPGYVDNPCAWMSRASVFVLSSAWEGLPGVLIEALACGCPAVSTDCPSGPAEILDDGKFGPLVPVADEKGMADAILSTLANPPPRERLRARAQFFSIDAAVDRYLDVLATQVRRAQTAGGKQPQRAVADAAGGSTASARPASIR
jgi:glycosyltransferase involved in cell wall biosynthesis